MNKDEEKAIEFIQEIIDFLGDDDYQLYTTDRNILITVLNLIKKQKEEIEELKQDYTKDWEDRCNLVYKELNEEIELYKSIIQIEKKKYKNTKKSLKGQIEKKDKIINEMASYIEVNEFDDDITSLYCNGVYDDCRHKEDIGHCKNCIIDYFTKKVEE